MEKFKLHFMYRLIVEDTFSNYNRGYHGGVNSDGTLLNNTFVHHVLETGLHDAFEEKELERYDSSIHLIDNAILFSSKGYGAAGHQLVVCSGQRMSTEALDEVFAAVPLPWHWVQHHVAALCASSQAAAKGPDQAVHAVYLTMSVPSPDTITAIAKAMRVLLGVPVRVIVEQRHGVVRKKVRTLHSQPVLYVHEGDVSGWIDKGCSRSLVNLVLGESAKLLREEPARLHTAWNKSARITRWEPLPKVVLVMPPCQALAASLYQEMQAYLLAGASCTTCPRIQGKLQLRPLRPRTTPFPEENLY